MVDFSRDDFTVLRQLETAGVAAAKHTDELWAKTDRLIGRLGSNLFSGGCRTALWPHGPGDKGERGPFLWARLKRTGYERFATHLGVFLSPGLCNLSVDLEKDLLDAGESAETLEQVVTFYREELPSLSDSFTADGLEVWTDAQNIVAAADFGTLDFTTFMDANRDAGHPWPKIGYVLSTDDVEGFGDRWLGEYSARAAPLVAVYDAMIRSFAG